MWTFPNFLKEIKSHSVKREKKSQLSKWNVERMAHLPNVNIVGKFMENANVIWVNQKQPWNLKKKKKKPERKRKSSAWQSANKLCGGVYLEEGTRSDPINEFDVVKTTVADQSKYFSGRSKRMW